VKLRETLVNLDERATIEALDQIVQDAQYLCDAYVNWTQTQSATDAASAAYDVLGRFATWWLRSQLAVNALTTDAQLIKALDEGTDF
jgi:hypothetical protein